jgi:hypothetical protein
VPGREKRRQECHVSTDTSVISIPSHEHCFDIVFCDVLGGGIELNSQKVVTIARRSGKRLGELTSLATHILSHKNVTSRPPAYIHFSPTIIS